MIDRVIEDYYRGGMRTFEDTKMVENEGKQLFFNFKLFRYYACSI
jgi:hypothetical protein